MTSKQHNFFDQKASQKYDEKNKKLGAINENLHLLIRLILQDLPENAHILCVGAGTGTEILYLANIFPQWRFTGIDPSAPMIEVCRQKLETAGIADRCTLITGYVDDAPADQFDAALCLLVTHFITDAAARQQTFDAMAARLKPGGYLINADISYDTASPLYDDMLEKWNAMHRYGGASEEHLAQTKSMLAEHLAVLPDADMEDFLTQAGLPRPVKFFQSLLISAWYAQKPD